ncbi:OB-fold-containig protein [Xanthobacteraceae bacterium A53D]
MQALVQPGTEPFWLALMVVAGLGLVELVSVLLGASASGLLDDGLGYHGPDHSEAGVLGGWMSWLNAGGVPLLVLAVILLSAFAAIGFALQSVAAGILTPLPLILAVPASFALALPLTRWSSRGVARIIPRDETSAVKQADLIGRLGTVTLGPLDQGKPGSVRVRDSHGNIHLLRATAADGHVIETGALVIIADGADGLFQAIPAPPELALNQGG